jgi:hypothetical protein
VGADYEKNDPMNRRALMAGMAAMAVGTPTTAQDSTPTAEIDPGEVMQRYLDEVL